MLTEKEIQTKATAEYKYGYTSQEETAFIHGATWANEALSAQIAELEAVNSEQADKIVALQTRREEHLRTIAELMGKKAELVAFLENVGSPKRKSEEEGWDIFEIARRARALVKKHTEK